jgi:hypothetical protein
MAYCAVSLGDEKETYIARSGSPRYHMGTADTAAEKEHMNGDK